MKRAALYILSCAAVGAAAAQAPTDSIGPTPLHEIVVTGVSSPVGLNLTPYSVSTVTASELSSTGATRLLSAISGMVPSLFVSERNMVGFGVSNGGAGHIKLRGVGGDRASGVLMLVDGQPQFAGIYSHHIADFYAMDYAERVEVLRGPASVLYGSNAMAGVVNVITKTAQEQGSRTTLTSRYGSYNTSITSATNLTRLGRFSSLVSADYDRTDGIVDDFDFHQISAYAKVAYDLNPHWTISADYSLVSFDANDPVYPSLRGQNGVYTQRVIRGEASAVATNRYGRTDGTTRLYYNYGNHFIHDPNYFHSVDDRIGLIVFQNFKAWTAAHITIGFDFDRYTGKIPVSGGKEHTDGSLTTMTRKEVAEYSPYLTISQGVAGERLAINGGLRVACSNTFHAELVPQLGLAFNPDAHWTAKASAARGYRNPSFRELYLYKFANPDLKPENMWNYEISLGRRFGATATVDLTAYYAKGSNMIEQGASQNSNTGSFINKGIEVSASCRPAQWIKLWASYSYLHSSVRNLTGAPRHQYFLGSQWRIGSRVNVDVDLKGVGRLYVADDVAHQNYALLNCRVSYRVVKPLQLILELNNITDARYCINRGYPMPQFNALGGFKLTI